MKIEFIKLKFLVCMYVCVILNFERERGRQALAISWHFSYVRTMIARDSFRFPHGKPKICISGPAAHFIYIYFYVSTGGKAVAGNAIPRRGTRERKLCLPPDICIPMLALPPRHNVAVLHASIRQPDNAV